MGQGKGTHGRPVGASDESLIFSRLKPDQIATMAPSFMRSLQIHWLRGRVSHKRRQRQAIEAGNLVLHLLDLHHDNSRHPYPQQRPDPKPSYPYPGPHAHRSWRLSACADRPKRRAPTPAFFLSVSIEPRHATAYAFERKTATAFPAISTSPSPRATCGAGGAAAVHALAATGHSLPVLVFQTGR